MNINFIIAAFSFFVFCYILGVFILPRIRTLSPRLFDMVQAIALVFSLTMLILKVFNKI